MKTSRAISRQWKKKNILATARLSLQPTIDAYTKDLDVLHADDVQFGKDKVPVQAEIDAYNAIPEKERTEAQYGGFCAQAPLDARWEAILARKAALARADAIKALSEQEQPLAKLQEVDRELLAQRKERRRSSVIRIDNCRSVTTIQHRSRHGLNE
jgi:hypothetical protein